MIEFKDVHKKYGKLEVLKGVSFTIKDGGIFAILGPKWRLGNHLHEELPRYGHTYQRRHLLQWQIYQKPMGL